MLGIRAQQGAISLLGQFPDSFLQLPAPRNDCPDLTFALPRPYNLLASTSVFFFFFLYLFRLFFDQVSPVVSSGEI
jgi:hypothetical protein